MTTFFLTIITGGIFIGIAECIYEGKKAKPYTQNLNNFLYNSPEENLRQKELIHSRSFFQSALSNGAIVLLVLLAYWLCL
jgi:hypothetical protein